VRGSSFTIGDMSQFREASPMSLQHNRHRTRDNHPGVHVARHGSDRLHHHTHVQQVAIGIPVRGAGDVMTFERGVLAMIDGKILTELDHGDGVRLVKVPLSKAAWSTWRRYCQALGLTMGRAIAGLIVHELGTRIGAADQHKAVYVAQLQNQLIARSEALDVREHRLDERERTLKAAQRLVRTRTRPIDMRNVAGVGRNDLCPCGSGYKYKRCHG